MLAKQLKELSRNEQPIKVIISTTHKEAYFIELQQNDQLIPIMDKKDNPIAYHNLEEIYQELRRFDIHTAYLVQNMPYDEMIGNDPKDCKPIEMKLEF